MHWTLYQKDLGNTTTWHDPTQGNAIQSRYPATVNAKVDKDAVMALPNRSNSMLIGIPFLCDIISAHLQTFNAFFMGRNIFWKKLIETMQ